MSAQSGQALHGSPARYAQGCRSSLECPNHGSTELSTCFAAAIRRRADWRVRRLPLEQQLPASLDAEPPAVHRDGTAQPVHGTSWGYRRGCRERHACPNWARGRITCPDARRAYLEHYRRRRLDGDGSSIVHGTLAGYDAGCRDEERCPADDAGVTCSAARRRYKLERARAAGVRPVSSAADPERAARRVRRWLTAGRSMRSIARATEVSRTTVVALASLDSSGSRRFSDEVVERILAVTGDER